MRDGPLDLVHIFKNAKEQCTVKTHVLQKHQWAGVYFDVRGWLGYIMVM